LAVPRAFLARARDRAPILRAKFSPQSDEKPQTVEVMHELGSRPTREGREFLSSLAPNRALEDFLEFYRKHDGVELCRTFDARYDEVRPLLELKSAASIAAFTGRYRPRGDLAWTIDLNKSKSLYRRSAAWLAFAEIDSGPACLTIFLDGAHAGSVFYVTPQPAFNVLRPIAKGFYPLLDRIAGDVAAFLRLVRATVTLRGLDGDNYGLVPIEYRSSGGLRRTRARRAKR
jgi:hypothetical protein